MRPLAQPVSRRPADGVASPPLTIIGGLCGSPLPPPASAAAGDGLVVLAQTRYEVLPAEHRVHVAVDAVATSFEPDTPQGQVYYSRHQRSPCQPAPPTSSASAGGRPIGARAPPSATTTSRSSRSPSAAASSTEQSYAYTVSFDLVDPGGEGTRDLRIGSSLVAFPVWAFGTQGEAGRQRAGGAAARATRPTSRAVRWREARAAGRRPACCAAEPDDPFAFFAYVTADRPGAFANRKHRAST